MRGIACRVPPIDGLPNTWPIDTQAMRPPWHIGGERPPWVGSLLDSQINSPAWTTVLVDHGPLASPRYSYAQVRYLDNWNALTYLQQFPSGSIAMQWNGSSWQRWP